MVVATNPRRHRMVKRTYLPTLQLGGARGRLQPPLLLLPPRLLAEVGRFRALGAELRL